MTLTCAIIDDEPLAIALLESYVLKTPFLRLVGTFDSAIDALPTLTDTHVDLLYLDIQMPQLSGMEFSRILTDRTRIIFTTAFSQYAAESYRVNALDYLLKPISYADFLKSAEKALRWYQLLDRTNPTPPPLPDATPSTTETSSAAATDENTPADPSPVESIFIKTEYKLVQVELRKILYIEGLKDYIKIFIDGEPQPLLSLMSMKRIEETLPSDHFVRVHRSYIVRLDRIRTIERNRIIFGKTHIPISDHYKPRFLTLLSRRSILPSDPH